MLSLRIKPSIPRGNNRDYQRFRVFDFSYNRLVLYPISDLGLLSHVPLLLVPRRRNMLTSNLEPVYALLAAGIVYEHNYHVTALYIVRDLTIYKVLWKCVNEHENVYY